MPRVINSPAFAGGFASYTPLDADEAWLLDHPDLYGALSGSGLAMRSVDNVWDDLATPGLSYLPLGTIETGARPSTDVNGRPSIRFLGTPKSRLSLARHIPPSYTILFSAVVTAPSAIIINATDDWPRATINITSTYRLSQRHNTDPDAVISTEEVVPGQPFVGWASYDVANSLAKVGLNSVNASGSKTFIAGASGAGAQRTYIGGGVGSESMMNGAIGDLFIFDTVLGEADLARVMRHLSRRSGAAVSGL